MTDARSHGANLFTRRLYQAALLVSAAAVLVTAASVLRGPAEGDYSGFVALVVTIYAAPGTLALVVAALFWRRPVPDFGPRLILALFAAIWGMLVLAMQLPFIFTTRGGTA